MYRAILMTGAALMLAGCGEEAAEQQPAKPQRAALTPGQYEAQWTVTQLRSTDATTPATELKQDETGTVSGCIAEGGKIDPSLFAETGEECTASSSFVRAGRISMQMECKRSSQPGQVMKSVNGTSTAEGFEAEVSTSTYLSGSGDYQMTRAFTGRRVGECTAGSTPRPEAAQ